MKEKTGNHQRGQINNLNVHMDMRQVEDPGHAVM